MVGGPCESRQICRAYLLPAQFFYSKCILRKLLTLKMKVKIMKYTIRNGPIRWQISTSIKVILEHFLLALTVFELFTFNNLWLWKYKSWCTEFSVASFDSKYLTSYLMAIVMFVFPSNICQNSHLKSLTLKI